MAEATLMRRRATSKATLKAAPRGVEAIRADIAALIDVAEKISGVEQGSHADFLADLLGRYVLPDIAQHLGSGGFQPTYAKALVYGLGAVVTEDYSRILVSKGTALVEKISATIAALPAGTKADPVVAVPTPSSEPKDLLELARLTKDFESLGCMLASIALAVRLIGVREPDEEFDEARRAAAHHQLDILERLAGEVITNAWAAEQLVDHLGAAA